MWSSDFLPLRCTAPPCVMTTGVWYGYRPKFQSPRHSKVVPNQNTTKVRTHSGPTKGQHVESMYVPGTPTTLVIFVGTLDFPDCTDSLIKGGPRRESVWLALIIMCLNRGTPHGTSWTLKGSRVYRCQTKGVRAGKLMT
jgi:hypothetical protein